MMAVSTPTGASAPRRGNANRTPRSATTRKEAPPEQARNQPALIRPQPEAKDVRNQQPYEANEARHGDRRSDAHRGSEEQAPTDRGHLHPRVAALSSPSDIRLRAEAWEESESSERRGQQGPQAQERRIRRVSQGSREPSRAARPPAAAR